MEVYIPIHDFQRDGLNDPLVQVQAKNVIKITSVNSYRRHKSSNRTWVGGPVATNKG
ncbi:uncharacterized protein METZ01_LOCUS151390 [marine metagenome]|uniref:Uncharacterized protein n=1 Tax=marine metagenome TaxID=408172 RepID=A0A382AAG0_9ZZZZ